MSEFNYSNYDTVLFGFLQNWKGYGHNINHADLQ